MNWPIMFVHAGFRDSFLKYIMKKFNISTPKDISLALNNILIDAISKCDSYRCALNDEAFQAGPDRGGLYK
jgi:hypothetical protein